MSHAAEPWETLSPMKTGRLEIAVAQLDGKVYVAGGIGFFKVLKSCAVFIVAENSWSKCPDLPWRLHHVALTSDGKHVYAAGGYTKLNFTHDEKICRFTTSHR